jgi:hypothetical protein
MIQPRSTLLTVLACALMACQPHPPEGGPTEAARAAGEPDGLLWTDRASYAPGSSATLFLRNAYDTQLGYNLCFSALERRTDAGAWEPSAVQEDRVCTAELRILEPGDTASFQLRIPPPLPAGEYRYRTRLEEMGAGRDIQGASRSFTVG